MIIQLMQHYQQQRGGYLTEVDLQVVADELGVELHQVQGLASFYPHFRLAPPAPVEVRVCSDMTCHARDSILLARRLEEQGRSHWPDRMVDVRCVSCLGRCDRPTAVMINEQLYVGRTEPELMRAIDQHVNLCMPHEELDLQEHGETVSVIETSQTVTHDTDDHWLCQRNPKWQIDIYQGQTSDFRLVRDYVVDPKPDEVLAALKEAGLLGMGGAGARTYLKWHDVRQARSQNKYIIANGDESEPGTFKDRDLLLKVPHLIIEGMILAGLVVGARRGWIFLRHEYHEQADRLLAELSRARSLGALGHRIFGSAYEFDLEVFVSPGGYIAGEQTALVEALEDRRAEPRIRPPELMTNGYKNSPTLLNNVETFAWVPTIVNPSGAEWFAEQGRSQHLFSAQMHTPPRGKRFFSISGDVLQPGVYEIPVGTTLGQLIDEHAGGMLPGKDMVAVALSGASGGLLPARLPLDVLSENLRQELSRKNIGSALEIRELPLDIHIARMLNIMLGAGIVVYGTGTQVLAEAVGASRFFRNECCGKCVPCRLGSQKITEMGERLLSGQVPNHELANTCRNIVELSQVMQATSICGLGQVAGNPLRSIIEHFPECLEKSPTPLSELDAAKHADTSNSGLGHSS